MLYSRCHNAIVYRSRYHFIFGKVCQKVQEFPIDSLCHSHLRPSGKRWDSISTTLYDSPVISQSQKRACINYILHTLFSFYHQLSIEILSTVQVAWLLFPFLLFSYYPKRQIGKLFELCMNPSSSESPEDEGGRGWCGMCSNILAHLVFSPYQTVSSYTHAVFLGFVYWIDSIFGKVNASLRKEKYFMVNMNQPYLEKSS